MNVLGVAARYDNLTVNGNPFKNEVYYVRDVDGEVLAEYDGGGNLLAEYVSANGQRIAKINPIGTVDLYLNDHLGSARAMVGSGWSANYYPFGELASQTGSDEDTRYDFTGKERDRGTGLMYFGARYYDPQIGRFLVVDPHASFYPSLTPYNYAGNNPLAFIDPTGMDSVRAQSLLDKLKRFFTSLFGDVIRDPNSPPPTNVDIPGVAKKAAKALGEEENVDQVNAIIQNAESGSGDVPTPDPNKIIRTPHGQERKQQAQAGDTKRQVDVDRVRREGRKFRDTETGYTIHFDSKRGIVVTKGDGEVVSQYKVEKPSQYKENKIRSGNWRPINE